MKAFLNSTEIDFEEGETILEAARRLGVRIPTLCEFSALNHRPGTCRVCLVEIERAGTGEKRLAASCETRLEEGMRVSTNSRRARDARRFQVELILSDHCEDCASCARHGDCDLQRIARETGVMHRTLMGAFEANRPVDDSAAALRFDGSRCIRCLRCIEACRSIQGVSALTFEETGAAARVGFAGAERWGDSDRCIQCGQCTLHCPTGALSVRDEIEKLYDWMDDPEITTVFEIAPAVRISLSESAGLPPGTNIEGELRAALKMLGADHVMDARFSADVTIMEEGTEVLGKLLSERDAGTLDHPFTYFTSCCPGWVNYVEKRAPDLSGHLSSTRSPQAIFGALAKRFLPEKLGIDPKKLRVISVMPCTAKKDEAARPQLAREGVRDVDLVLTVREMTVLLARAGINLAEIEPEPVGNPLFAEGSGASELFATTGGVMEAALRTLTAITGSEPFAPEFRPVRGLEGVKESEVTLKGLGSIRIAVVHGLVHIEPILEAVRKGQSRWHFVEVMACPGGCIGGGGNLRWRDPVKRLPTLEARQAGVYAIDRGAPIVSSHENPEVKRLYEEHLGSPGSEAAHELLHTYYRTAVPDAKHRL